MATGLDTFVNHTVSIITSDGRNFIGTLKGFDQTINIILDESHERVYSSTTGVEQVMLGLHIIRGDNVLNITYWMKILLFATLWTVVQCADKVNPNGTHFTTGTVLFAPGDLNKACWTTENSAILTTRLLMRNLMPNVATLKAEDDSFVTDLIDYFRLLLEVIRANTTGKTKHIVLLAFTDNLGGYMKHLILPITKYAYYAGNLDYSSIIKLYQLYDELKNYLRTNGNGWAKAWKRAGKHIQAKAIPLQTPVPTTDPCKGLIYYKHSHKDKRNIHQPKGCHMEVPLPFFDSKTHPSAIAVPFKTFGLRNLESRVSSYILVKFYVAVSKCMASRNTDDVAVQKFNTDVYSFIMNKVMPHLCDDKFYAAFGGVLRILETIKQAGNKNGKQIGSFNILPEVEEREPYADMGEEETIPGFDQTEKSDKKSKNNLILLAALATIIIWFCLGAVFVCCRVRASKIKKDEKIKALQGTKPTKDEIEACNEETCPAFEVSSQSTVPDYNVGQTVMKGKDSSTKSSTRSTHTTEGESEESKVTDGTMMGAVGAPELRVQSMQYYPPSFACHTSITGKLKPDSSTDDYTSREEPKRPYVFGYDFQTTSEDSSPRETSDGEIELGGNMSK